MGPPPAPASRLIAIAWARFQPRTAVLARELGGAPAFVHAARLESSPALLPLRYLAAAGRTWRLLERHCPERVVAVTPPVFAPLVTWLWCRLRRRTLAVDCHTGTFHSRRWRWARPLHRLLLRRSRAALVHTEEALALVGGWGAPGVLLPDDLPTAADAPTAPSPERPTVVVAGSLDTNEPVADVLAAAALLPEAEVRLTGDPARVPAAARAAAPANVVFTGFLPYRRFLGELRAAHVVAAFSDDPHIMNRAAFEAVGLGRPLVLSDLPGLRARFGAAAVFAANEPGAMARALREALARRPELASRSLALAEELRGARERALAGVRTLLVRQRGARPRSVLVLTQHSLPRHATARRNVVELARRGLEVDVICTEGLAPEQVPPEAAGRLRFYAIPIAHRRRAFSYALEYGAFLAGALALTSALSLRRRYAVVQSDNLPDVLLFAAVVPRLRGARLVLNMFELAPEMVAARFGDRLGRLTRRLEAAAVRWADTVIVVSRPCRDVLRARGVPDDKVVVVVNTTASPPPAAAGPGHGGYLITHGTLVERYGTHLALQALARLRERFPGAVLRVVGDGEQLPALRRLAAGLGIAERVVFTGNLPWETTLAEVSRAALGIVAVLPGGYGDLLLPTKLLEYARLGVPAVCARLPAIEAYFPDAAVAYFTPGDAGELAAQVERLLRDPELARRKAAGALEVARELAWERQRDRYFAALGLAEGPGGAAGEHAPAGSDAVLVGGTCP